MFTMYYKSNKFNCRLFTMRNMRDCSFDMNARSYCFSNNEYFCVSLKENFVFGPELWGGR